MSNLAGRVAIVTGSSRGIGFRIAQRLVMEGWRVCLTGRGKDSLEQALETLNAPDRVMGVAGKADDSQHQESTVKSVLESYGSIDLLVNNTGINPVYGPLMTVDLAAARKTFEVNILSGLRWTQLTYEHWMAKHGGCVVNVASITGLTAANNIGVYGVSKAAVIAMTRQLGYELGPQVRVNAVAPGIIKTDFSKALYEENEEDVVSSHPMGRLGAPNDVAGAVLFLASEDAGWITGQTIVLDGGLTLGGRL
jgi:NAD(P)-dependent dehydrogenase (short-subunit alcohol dehydrogenase family)